MEIFHHCSNLSKNEVIDRYMQCIMQNKKMHRFAYILVFIRSTHRSLFDSLTCRFYLFFKLFVIGVYAVYNKPISKD